MPHAPLFQAHVASIQQNKLAKLEAVVAKVIFCQHDPQPTMLVGVGFYLLVPKASGSVDGGG